MKIMFLSACAVALCACGNTSTPTEQKAPVEQAEAAAVVGTTTIVAQNSVQAGEVGAASAETVPDTSEAQPEAAIPRGRVECYAGDHKVISEYYYNDAKMGARTEWQTKDGGSTWSTLPCTFSDL